jgi:hypothetical protein
VHDYNKSGGDLPGVLRQVLAPVNIPLYINEQFKAFGAGDKWLTAALTADMDGIHGGRVVGRFTVLEALRMALDGTNCQHELIADQSMYVFCCVHLVFSVNENDTDRSHPPAVTP